jgi:hypothetical protein
VFVAEPRANANAKHNAITCAFTEPAFLTSLPSALAYDCLSLGYSPVIARLFA